MRHVAMMLLILVAATACCDDKQVKPITPAEAAKKVNEKVTVEMEVKSAGGNTARFLNSEKDFKDEKNLTVFIPEESMEKFKKAKIGEPKTYFNGKTILVTGTVTLYREKPQIKIDDPDQIKIKDKPEEKK
jgi:DNA/RNA endonuclease YhcR with UshA esterase domain